MCQAEMTDCSSLPPEILRYPRLRGKAVGRRDDGCSVHIVDSQVVAPLLYLEQ